MTKSKKTEPKAKKSKSSPTKSEEVQPEEPAPRKTRKRAQPSIGDIAAPGQGERSSEQDRFGLKRKVRYFYDLQRLRLQVGGRLSKRPEGTGIDLHAYDVALLHQRAAELHAAERAALGDIADHLKTIPFFVDVLSDKETYRGIGPTMAGVILSEFDIRREEMPSQMWSYAGLAPVPAKRCKHCQSVVVEKDGGLNHIGVGDKKCKEKLGRAIGPEDLFDSGRAMRPTRGEKLPYNSFLKMKLVGVLGAVLIKCGSPWRKFYDDYKHRKASEGWGQSDAHRHQAAIRYMIKMLLLDIYVKWRTFEKLPVRQPYQEEYLGHVHHKKAKPEPKPPKAKSNDSFMVDEIEAELEILKQNEERLA